MDKTLVILAAGMGSRFGGPKQFYPVGPNNEFIMDYSIYSAIKYGFNKIVFVIREEFLDKLKNTICKRIEGKVDYGIVFQKLDNLPDEILNNINISLERTKPWGTAHAFYCAKEEVVGNVAVITADDFYGDEAFKDLSNALDTNAYTIIGYKIKETMSLNGAVKRGVTIVEDGNIRDVIESECMIENDQVKCTPVHKNIKPFYVPFDNPVSMLMYGFTKEIFDNIYDEMENTFKNNKNDLLNFEFFLPDIIAKEIEKGRIVKNIETNSKWVGMTYKEDAYQLSNYINELIDSDVYTRTLWKNKTY